MPTEPSQKQIEPVPSTALERVRPGGNLTGLESEIAAFDFAQRKAKMIATSSIVPELFRGEKGVANVMVALEISNRLNVPLMSVLQNLIIIHNRPSWPSSFLVALVNLSGKFSQLHYESGTLGKAKYRNAEFENLCCRIVTTNRAGEKVEGPMVTMEMAHKDGWTKNEKYQSLPETLLRWRAVSFFVRAVCPEIALGIPATEELDLPPPRAGRTTFSSEPDPRRPRIEVTPSREFGPTEPPADLGKGDEFGGEPTAEDLAGVPTPTRPIEELLS